MPSVHPRSPIACGVAPPALRLLPADRGWSLPAPAQAPSAPFVFDADLSRTLAALGGDSARKRLHALHPARPGDEGAATGFAFTLLGTLLAPLVSGMPRARSAGQPALRRPILWVQDRTARAESGRPYGLGFAAFGVDPDQLVLVSTKGALEALAAVEIGLEIGGLAGVLAELPPSLPADMLTLGKRLALRAERSMTPCLLLHAAQRAVPTPVATRWEIASLPAVPSEGWGAPVPVAAINLVKNRFGPTGRWSVPLGVPSQGVPDVCVTSLAPPLPKSVAADVADRSRPAPRYGRAA
jgi:hypothetical protein